MTRREPIDVNYEGYWRTTRDEENESPWPTPQEDWAGREPFLLCLDRAEADAERVAFRGHSFCRVCRCANGSEELRLSRWVWPAGYRHYVAEHSVRPSIDFEAFILDRCG